MLVFLSYFPDDTNIKDGMAQRINHIDHIFANTERIYINADLKRYFKKNIVKQNNRTVINCHPIIHFFLIMNILRQAKAVYIHSVYNVLYLYLHILLTKNKYTLDLHGVVPEENKLAGSNLKYHLYNYCEKMIFRKAKTAICVTNAMAKHYKTKYKNYQIEYIIFSILPETIMQEKDFENDKQNKATIIYSGNTQKWQNIDLMIDTIKNNLSENIDYQILTSETEKFTKLFENRIPNYKENNIVIFSVDPSQLSKYYQVANYGFILRDDITVNRVACPTKLIEYMSYGLIPIVLSPKIGDFDSLGFEYIQLDTKLSDLKALKSQKNREIILKVKNNNLNVDLVKIIFS